MKRTTPSLLCFVTVVTVVPVLLGTPAVAQDLTRLYKPGDPVRVQSQNGAMLEGRTLAVRSDALVLVSGIEGIQDKRAFTTALQALQGGPGGETYLSQYVAWAEVDTLSQADIAGLWRQGNDPGTGAIVGAAVAGIGTGVLATFFCYGVGEGSCDAWGFVFMSSLAGAGAGALLGGAIGLAVPKWHRVESSVEVGVSLAPNGKLGLGARVAL